MQNHAKKWYNDISSTHAMAAIAIGAMLVFSAAAMKGAFADNIVNDISSDAGDTETITAGDSTGTTVGYKIVATGSQQGDPVSGCNADSTHEVTVTINTPSGVHADPSSLKFTSCNDFKYVQFTADEGVTFSSKDVTVDASGGKAGAVFKEDPATFSLTVQAGEPETCPEGQTGTPPNCEDTPPADTTPPKITYDISGTLGNAGWYTSDVTIKWTVEDLESAVDESSIEGCKTVTISTDTTGEPQTCKATSAGGTSTESVTIKRDATKPTVSLVGGPKAQDYDFGDVPSAPTCDASDATSGLDGSCSVSGYGDTVGSHTVTATAKDKAGNENTASITYTVVAWTLKGFYQPVDMNGVTNTVKSGSTVPLKFEIFKTVAGTEITATSAIITPLRAIKVTCDSGSTLDDIETLASGGTVLRYDSTGGQFVYNWQTPSKQPGACYNVNIKTIDGTTFLDPAEFKLK